MKKRSLIFLSMILIMMFSFVSMRMYSGRHFQQDSETLVTGAIHAYFQEIDNKTEYNLGRFENINAKIFKYNFRRHIMNFDFKQFNGLEFVDGYHKDGCNIVVVDCLYNRNIFKNGNNVRFKNNIDATVVSTNVLGKYLNIELKSEHFLEPKTCGSLNDIMVTDLEGNTFPKGVLHPYVSQYGLQGKVFKFIASFLPSKFWIPILLFLNCMFTASVLSTICWFIYKKYNVLMACCFYFTFLTSPWITMFASNLYWVEFTWFIPMLVGLICSLYGEKRIVSYLCYFSAFVFILIKSLCGYEYISTIMVSTILFPLYDVFVAYENNDGKSLRISIRHVIMLGLFAVAGFALALLMHSFIRGDGNIKAGLESIYIKDVLRRTYGGNDMITNPIIIKSLETPVWYVLSKYFMFKTSLVAGIPGPFFPIMAFLPLCFWWKDRQNNVMKQWNKILILYWLTFLATVSWLVLAKGHSYIHTHMNYVLWYFGFVQICLYILIKRIISLVMDYKEKIVDEISNI